MLSDSTSAHWKNYFGYNIIYQKFLMIFVYFFLREVGRWAGYMEGIWGTHVSYARWKLWNSQPTPFFYRPIWSWTELGACYNPSCFCVEMVLSNYIKFIFIHLSHYNVIVTCPFVLCYLDMFCFYFSWQITAIGGFPLPARNKLDATTSFHLHISPCISVGLDTSFQTYNPS